MIPRSTVVVKLERNATFVNPESKLVLMVCRAENPPTLAVVTD
ncbi:MAG TPA: hypothetical protein VHY91_02535 [Pirellulales bacterium]|nr:hypothetical protein [Pirellulales bacterium]